jgi:hypothetical protein
MGAKPPILLCRMDDRFLSRTGPCWVEIDGTGPVIGQGGWY